jgi:hypothetical protein
MRKYAGRTHKDQEAIMFGTLAQTLFHASGIAPKDGQRGTDRETRGAGNDRKTTPKRWEDWR